MNQIRILAAVGNPKTSKTKIENLIRPTKNLTQQDFEKTQIQDIKD